MSPLIQLPVLPAHLPACNICQDHRRHSCCLLRVHLLSTVGGGVIFFPLLEWSSVLSNYSLRRKLLTPKLIFLAFAKIQHRLLIKWLRKRNEVSIFSLLRDVLSFIINSYAALKHLSASTEDGGNDNKVSDVSKLFLPSRSGKSSLLWVV